MQGEMELDMYNFGGKVALVLMDQHTNSTLIHQKKTKKSLVTFKFFRLLEELFVDSSQADGSLALDQSTVNVISDSGVSGSVKELKIYSLTVEDGGNDFGTIARNSPTIEGTNLGKKHKRIKSPAKNSRRIKETVVKHQMMRWQLVL